MYMMERESWSHVLLLLCFMLIIMSNACHCFMLCFNYMLLIVGQKLLKACVVLLLTCRLKINIYLSIDLFRFVPVSFRTLQGPSFQHIE